VRRIAVILCAILVVASPAAATGSFLLRAGARFQHVGDFWIERDPTYRGAIKAFGPGSSCRLARGAGGATAVWTSIGVRIRLETLGGLPPGKTGCTAPGSIYVDNVRVSSRRWTTARGLRVGDSEARLRTRYPQAAFHRPGLGGGFPSNAYWLVTRRTACIGVCRTEFVTVPQLAAAIRDGRVAFFALRVGAQGD
jgi:hypothetical protein